MPRWPAPSAPIAARSAPRQQARDVLPSFVADLPLSRAALRWASAAHGEQRRDSDDARFIIHPLEVASLLHNTGFGDSVIAAGILHDTVEDTDLSRGEIERAFGAAVAGVVAALTEDPAIEDYEPRKRALREQVRAAGTSAGAVYAADKVAKVREMRTAISRARGAGVPAEVGWVAKLEHYWRSAEMLERLMPAHSLVRQLRFELEMLHMLPPGNRPLNRAPTSPSQRSSPFEQAQQAGVLVGPPLAGSPGASSPAGI